MRQPTSLPAARAVAVSALLAAVIVALIGAACSLIVTDKLPTYFCVPDADLACAADQVCRPNGVGTQYVCAPKCHVDRDCVTGTCDPHGWCVTVVEAGAPDTGSGDGALEAEVSTDAGRDATMVDATTDSPTDRSIADREAAAADAEAGSNDGQVSCAGFGCKCSAAVDCPTGFACVSRQAVTSNIWDAWIDAGGGDGSASGFCAEPCCTSTDCDTSDAGVGSTVCFATGAGGNYCVPPGWLGDRGTIGPANNSGGAACAADAGACRSGLCVSGICSDTCCSNYAMNECATGSACHFGLFPGTGFDTHQAAHCVATTGPPGSTGGMQCMANTDCRSSLCLLNDAGMFGPPGMCRDACRVPDECAGTGGIRSPQGSCEYVQPFTSTGDLATVCLPVQLGGAIRGDGGGGATCQFTSDCSRGYCAGGRCLVVCYVDVQGSSGDCSAGERCRPQSLQLVDGGPTYSVLGCGM